jgi:hypothetical protein
MKNLIWRTSALAFAAGLAGTLACGASSTSCGGTNLNADSSAPTGMVCGAGTYLSGSQCVPLPSSSGAGTPAAGGAVKTN